MYSLLLTLAVIAAIFLIVVVLLQASKGSGLAGTFGGAQQVGAMFGTRRTADFLSKATWVLAATVVALALIINLFFLPGKAVTKQRQAAQQEAPADNGQ